MKILHLCLSCFYIDNYSYQENMLPKYHKLMGHDVTVIASLLSFDKNGKLCLLKTAGEYICGDGYKVKRLEYKKPFKLFNRKFRRYKKSYDSIERENPAIIFIHGCQFWDIRQVVKYIERHPNVKVYVDNHADFSNSASNFLSLYILHKIIWKYCAHLIEPFTEKFYGVLPARVDFLINIYKIPKLKCELLVMGADDEKVNFIKNNNVRDLIRRKYRFSDDEFIVITGGKIDSAKAQILLLLQAVQCLNSPKIKLIIFGTIAPEIKEKLLSFVDNIKIYYIGWIKSDEVYDYFAASDLAIFPGRHSVLWEQAVGTGIPCFFKYWKGTTHVDLGGNCKFLYNDQMEEIKNALEELLNNPDSYLYMRKIAEEKGIKSFSYKEIARKAIQFL